MVWQQAAQKTQSSVFKCRRLRTAVVHLVSVVLLLCFLSGECSTKSTVPESAGDLSGRRGRSTLQDDGFFQDLCPNGELIKEYNCNCDIIPTSDVDTDTKTIEGGTVKCTPICSEDDKVDCLNRCPDGTKKVGLCSTSNCNTEVPLAAVDVVRSTKCTLDEATKMWDCGGVLSVDSPTIEAIREGTCVEGCSRPQYPCFFPARFGPPLELLVTVDVTKEETEEENSVATETVIGDCDGVAAEEFVCGCQLYSRERALKLIEVSGGQDIGCSPVCDNESDPLELCKAEASECTNYMCIQGECAVILGKEAVDIIQSNECGFSEMFNMVQCGDALLVDQPTFESVSSGGCIPGCGVQTTQLRCEKKARFGPSILLDPKAKITGENAALAPGPDTETSLPQVQPESAPSPESDVDTPSSAPTTDKDSTDIPATSPEEAFGPAPGEDTVDLPQAEPAEQPTPNPLEAPDDGPASESPIPEPEEAPAPAPVDDVDGAPTPEPEEVPAPAPVDDVDGAPTPEPEEAPAPAPVDDLDGAPIPEPEEAPAPAPFDDVDGAPTPEPEEAPAPAPFDDVDGAPTPEPEEGPAPAPVDSEDEAPTPEPEDVPAPAPVDDVDEAPTPQPELEEVPAPAPDDEDIEDSPAPAPELDLDIPFPAPEEGPAPEPEEDLEDFEEVPAPAPDLGLDEIPVPAPEEGPAPEPEEDLEDFEEVPAPAPDLDLDEIPVPAPEEGPAPEPEEDLEDFEEVPAPAPDLGSSIPDPEPEEAPSPSPQEDMDGTPVEELEESPAPRPETDTASIPDSEPDEVPGPSPIDDLERTPILGPQEGPAMSPVSEEVGGLAGQPTSSPSILAQPPESAQTVELIVDERRRGAINSTELVLAGEISSGVWRDCTIEGTKERSVICRTATGLPILDTNCDQSELKDKKDQGVEDCQIQNEPCNSCSKECAAINEETGQLVGGTPETEGGTVCGEAGTCNTFPCDPVRLRPGPWTECSCESSTQTREVDCVNGQGEAVDRSICDAQLAGIDTLPQERNCTAAGCPESQDPQLSRRLLQDVKGSPCDGVTCSGRGDCSGNGVCTCNKGFEGPDCQVDVRKNSSCPGGVLNADGDCCQSGVFDLEDEKCCEGSNARLDKDGRCCEGEVDFCGVCGGSGVVDIQGKCCEVLASSGLCCESGDVDQCGVCGGTGSTCTTRLALEIDLKEDPEDFTTCFQEWVREEVFREQGSFKPELNMTLKGTTSQEVVLHVPKVSGTSQSLERTLRNVINSPQLREIERNPCNIIEIGQVSRLPECGNKFCEIQETPGLGGPTECQADCPFIYSICGTHSDDPDAVFSDDRAMCAGHGACFPAGPNPTCLCHRGFEGDLCDQCGAEQVNVGGFCVKRQRPLLLQNKTVLATIQDVPEQVKEALDDENGGSDGLGMGAIIGIVVAAVVVFLVCVAVVTIIHIRKRQPKTAGARSAPDLHQGTDLRAPNPMYKPSLPDGGRESVHPGNKGDPPSQKVVTPTEENTSDSGRSWEVTD